MKSIPPWSRRRSTGPGLSPRRTVIGRFGRATVRSPGPDLTKLTIGLDLRSISLAEGARAALASASILVANLWIGSPSLVIAALAAQLTCFCDAGGSVRRRLPWLLAFTFVGAATWACFGLLRAQSAPLILMAVFLFILVSSFVRVWGLAAQAVGNVLTVVAALALDRPLAGPEALTIAACFAAGGLWATLLTLVIWRIRPDGPARDAIAETVRLLSLLVADARDLSAGHQTDLGVWDGHARAHRRAVRDAIERARIVVSDLVRSRGPLSLRGAQNLLRLETADQMFGVLIGLTDLLERARSDVSREAGAKILRLLAPSLLVVAHAIHVDRLERPARIERAADRMLSIAAAAPGLLPIVEALASRLRIVAVIAAGDETDAYERPQAAEAAVPFRERVLAPVRINLTWRSAILRHAVRAAVVAVPAVAFALIWVGPFQHWLTITVVLTMQPYIAATWQRAVERVGGTIVGALIGAALAFVPHGPLVTAALLFPLSAIGFAVRQVSYGAFIACLTPFIVVLIEVVEPGQSEWVTAGMRVVYSLAGGLLAVGCCLALWPSWEPNRLKAELRTTLLAYADWARQSLSALADGVPNGADQARRESGIAHNNLETALSRALQEPSHAYDEGLEAMMVADAALRRFGGSMMGLQHAKVSAGSGSAAAWRDWLPAALHALADRSAPATPVPAAQGSETLERLGRQVDLLSGALKRVW